MFLFTWLQVRRFPPPPVVGVAGAAPAELAPALAGGVGVAWAEAVMVGQWMEEAPVLLVELQTELVLALLAFCCC